jgi:Eukaryotic cytochrome b561
MALTTGMIHGLIMMLGFGWLLPLGVLSARLMKHRPDNLWFDMHQKLQLFGIVIGLIGFGIAVKNFNVYEDPKSSTSYRHGVLGAITFALVLLQALVALIRPGPNEGNRGLWQWKHKILGYLLLIFIFATTLLGAKMEGTAWQLGYVFGVVGSLVLIAGLMWFDRFSYQAPQVNEEGAEMRNVT